MKRNSLILYTAIILSTVSLACTRNAFVNGARGTLLSVNEAVTVMDEVVADHYADAPLDDAKANKAIDEWTCAFITVDTVVLTSWAILRRIEAGPPKLDDGDVMMFVKSMAELAPPVMYLLYLGEAYGLDTGELKPALDAIKKYLGTGEPLDVPDLNCSDILGGDNE